MSDGSERFHVCQNEHLECCPIIPPPSYSRSTTDATLPRILKCGYFLRHWALNPCSPPTTIVYFKGSRVFLSFHRRTAPFTRFARCSSSPNLSTFLHTPSIPPSSTHPFYRCHCSASPPSTSAVIVNSFLHTPPIHLLLLLLYLPSHQIIPPK